VGDIDVPIPEGTRWRWPRAGAFGATLYRHGLIFAFDPTRPDTVSSRPLIPANDPPLTPHPYLTYDWSRPVLTVDSPGAKIMAGFFNEMKFSDGVTVELASPEFAVLGIVSTTTESLEETSRAVLVATSTGENKGAVIEPEEGKSRGEITKHWGTGPIQAKRVTADFQFPASWNYVLYDFLFKEIGKGSSSFIELNGEPLFIADLERPQD
jgi:hypothetical protein